jgi:hypothetical protein
MKIDFAPIAHNKQRYESAGDWFKKAGVWYFRVSRMKDKRYIWLVFLHEFIEWAICQLTGVKQRDVDKFDQAYETTRADDRALCGCKIQDEPGDDIHAPYHDAHAIASECERLIAKALDVDWIAYNETVNRL